MAADLEALSDLRTPWCLHVAVTLGIAGHLADNGAMPIAGLAEAAQCDADALQRVLSHLARRDVFAEPHPGTFELNDAARGLLDPGLRIGLDLEGIGGRMAHAWGTLLEFVRTGRPAYAERFGLPFWEDLAAHPTLAASFDALVGPTGHGTPDPHFPLARGWESVRSVVDVGGGAGSMLAEILCAHPHVHGILVDQPNTVARCTPTDRLTAIGQSFFDPLPAGADVYLLRGILNDWPDREAIALLRRCAEAAHPSHGRVVILKSVGPDGEPKDLHIETLLAGGKHRTITEFTALARHADLAVVAAGTDPASVYFTVECEPV